MRAMSVYALSGTPPELHPDTWIAPSASVIGTVALARGASVWFGAVLRGDTDWIRIGEDSNIQDLSVVHADLGVPTTVGARVTVGHKVMLHGCTVEDECLIGIGAVLLNGARIGAGSVVGAGALVTSGKVYPPRSMILGAPAKVLRQVTDEELDGIRRSADHYAKNARRFREELVALPR